MEQDEVRGSRSVSSEKRVPRGLSPEQGNKKRRDETFQESDKSRSEVSPETSPQ